MATANILNIKNQGLVAYDGSATFNGRTLSATSSKISITNGNGASGNPSVDAVEANFTLNNIGGVLGISKGGTNATSFSTTNGIVKYNGTSLATSSTALIDGSNRQTNTSQPCVFAHLTTSLTNQTGDGTVVDVIYETTRINQGSAYSTSTGTFTAPITGSYYFSTQVTCTSLSASFTSCQIFSIVRGQIWMESNYNLANMRNTTNDRGELTQTSIVDMAAGETLKMQIQCNGGTKTVGILGVDFGLHSTLSIYLLC